MPIHRQTVICGSCHGRFIVSAEHATNVRSKNHFSLPCPACGVRVAVQVPYGTDDTPQVLSYERARPL